MYPIPLAIFIVCSLAALGLWLWYQHIQKPLPEPNPWLCYDNEEITPEALETLRKWLESPWCGLLVPTSLYRKYWDDSFDPTGMHAEDWVAMYYTVFALAYAVETYTEEEVSDLPEDEQQVVRNLLRDGYCWLPATAYGKWVGTSEWVSEASSEHQADLLLLVAAAEGLLP